MEKPTCRVILYQGTSIIDRLVRLQTRSKYSHAAIALTPAGGEFTHTYESTWKTGVHCRNFSRADWSADWFIIELRQDQYDKLKNWLDLWVNQNARYDTIAICRFLTRRRGKSDTRWFCSELVFAALQHVGITLLRDTEAWEVSPGLLSKSPLLELDGRRCGPQPEH